MSKNKQTDQQPSPSENPIDEQGATPDAEIAASANGATAKESKAKKPQPGYQGIRSGFRDAHKGPKIGNAPRGTRRTMGKR